MLSVKIYIEGHRNDLESVVADAENFAEGRANSIAWISIWRFLSHLLELGEELVLRRCAKRGGRTPQLARHLCDPEGTGLEPRIFSVVLRSWRPQRVVDHERALALINEGLAMAREGGQRVWDAFLHRLRGDFLLKRDLANPASAEGCLPHRHCHRKGARRAELRACRIPFACQALPIERPTRRRLHAVLAPALEGFRRRPKCRRLAEAQALLVAIEANPVINTALRWLSCSSE